MPTMDLVELSGSTDGRPILVAATATPGTTIHTAGSVTGANNYDKIRLWASNTDTTARKLTIEWGGTTSPNDLFELTLAPEDGLVLIVPGLVLQNALLVRAFAAAANLVNISGYVIQVRA